MFLGLDLATNMTTQNQPQLLALRRKGVEDLVRRLRPAAAAAAGLLPVRRPEILRRLHRHHFAGADGIVTSRAPWPTSWPTGWRSARTAAWRRSSWPTSTSAPTSTPARRAAACPTTRRRHVLARWRAPTLLMVGTLEPRKGQAQALAAFELLWAKGVDANLVIVGKNGWLVDALAERLQAHPQRERSCSGSTASPTRCCSSCTNTARRCWPRPKAKASACR
jgi:glycosyltransferase involved in cell wall biosynthesis